MRKYTLILVCVLLALALVSGAFIYGKRLGEKNGYSRGVEEYMIKMSAAEISYKDQLRKSQEEYSQLVKDYNTLYDAAIRYVSAPRGPVTCSSNIYGIDNQFMNTICY